MSHFALYSIYIELREQIRSNLEGRHTVIARQQKPEGFCMLSLPALRNIDTASTIQQHKQTFMESQTEIHCLVKATMRNQGMNLVAYLRCRGRMGSQWKVRGV